MPLHLSYIAQENRLDLRFEGNLDLTVSQTVCDICKTIPTDLTACIIDLTGIERLFDSGVALLQKLYRRLVEIGTTVVILSDHPRIRSHFPTIARASLDASPRHPPFVFGQPTQGGPVPF
jgi:ABC-type transporter Mla MlaB component